MEDVVRATDGEISSPLHSNDPSMKNKSKNGKKNKKNKKQPSTSVTLTTEASIVVDREDEGLELALDRVKNQEQYVFFCSTQNPHQPLTHVFIILIS